MKTQKDCFKALSDGCCLIDREGWQYKIDGDVLVTRLIGGDFKPANIIFQNPEDYSAYMPENSNCKDLKNDKTI